MKLALHHSSPVAAPRESAAILTQRHRSPAVCRRAATGTSAFTMIEIALCLAIVGFALVAIIGVLPAGLNVQKDNREETIINEEAALWMDALRAGGPQGFDPNVNPQVFDTLADYVDRIVISSQNFDQNDNPVGGTIVTVAERTPPSIGDNQVAFYNRGELIVSLLTTPKVAPPTPGVTAAYSTNYVVAYVRAFSGIAAEKPPQDNADVRDLAFSYRLVVDTAPLGAFDPGLQLTNRLGQTVQQNLADVRLLFRWPLRQSVTRATPLNQPEVGPGRLAFRTQLGGRIEREGNVTYTNVAFYFLRPRDYIRPNPYNP